MLIESVFHFFFFSFTLFRYATSMIVEERECVCVYNMSTLVSAVQLFLAMFFVSSKQTV